MNKLPSKKIDVVAAVITDDVGRILVTQRGSEMDFSGKWEFPGGKIKEGETAELALKREIKEELLLDIETGELLLAWVYKYPFAEVKFMAFKAKISSGELTLLEHMDFKWINTPVGLKGLDWVPADNILVDFLNK
ncbi:MAG: (deoxy)nucleoside triphosphate pyrophosphohydrolase [bacterium]